MGSVCTSKASLLTILIIRFWPRIIRLRFVGYGEPQTMIQYYI
jgi:hypothetical protein